MGLGAACRNSGFDCGFGLGEVPEASRGLGATPVGNGTGAILPGFESVRGGAVHCAPGAGCGFLWGMNCGGLCCFGCWNGAKRGICGRVIIGEPPNIGGAQGIPGAQPAPLRGGAAPIQKTVPTMAVQRKSASLRMAGIPSLGVPCQKSGVVSGRVPRDSRERNLPLVVGAAN